MNPIISGMRSNGRYILLLVFGINSLLCRADGCQSAAFSFFYDIPVCTGQFVFQGITDCGVGAGNSTWIWDFGDGSPQLHDVMNPVHEYLYEGVYTVTLWMYPFCHGPGNPPCINTQPINVLFPNLADIVPVVISNYNGQDVSCTDACDGVIQIESVGAGYSIEWGDFPAGVSTVSNVCPGTYYVYSHPPVGCGYTQGIVEVANPPPFTYTFNQDSLSCFGQNDGIASISPSGGTPGYTITWSSGAIGPVAHDLDAGAYTIQIVDANGCEFSAQGSLQELPEIFANAFVSSDYNGFDISCYDGNDGAADANPSGGSPPYYFSWDDTGNQTTQVATNLQQDDYTVYITDSQGCTVEDSVSLFHPTPVVSAVQIISDYHGVPISCYDAEDGIIEVTYASGGTGNNVSNYTYQWYEVPDGCQDQQCWSIIPGATTTQINFAAEGTYVVGVSDLNNCTAYEYQSIEEPPPIDINIAITSNYNGSAISCNGAEDGQITFSATGGTGGYLSQWTNNGNTGNVNSNLASGIYEVQLTDANGCFASDSIFVPEPPAIVVSGTVTSNYNGEHISCFDSEDGTMQGQASGGVAPLTLFWSNGVLGPVNSLDVHAGTYTLTAIDANSCHEQTQVIVIPPPELEPVIDILTDYNGYPISCFGENDAAAEVTAEGGTGNYTYLWTGTIAPNQTINVAGQISSGMLVVQVTDQNGCVAEDSVFVNQPPALGATLAVISDYHGQDISCFGASDGAVQAYPNGGVPPYTYDWDADDNVTGNVLSGLPYGITGITVEDLNGCEYDTEILVTQPDPLTSEMDIASDYNGSDTSCPGSSDGIAHVTPIGGTAPYFYLWPNGESNATSGVFYPEGYVEVTVWDANQCMTQDSIFITTPPPIVNNIAVLADYNGYSVSCFGAEDGIVQSTATGGTGDFTYTWANDYSGTINDHLGAGLQIVTAMDVNGCIIQDTVLLTEPTELSALDSVLSEYNSWNISCFGYHDGSASIEPSGGIEPYTIQWSSGETTPTAVNLAAGYQAVTVTDLNGCDTTYNVLLLQPPPLTSTFEAVTDTCLRSHGTALAIAAGGTPPYAYLWADWHEEPYIDFLPSGSHSVQITDANGCNINPAVEIPNIPSPIARFEASDMDICIVTESTVVNFTDLSENNPVVWSWDFSIGNPSSDQNPSHDFFEPGLHEIILTVENEFQCKDDTSMTILIRPDMTLFLPNAFTPNNDGLNDTFYPQGTEVETIEYNIFDRWGSIIYTGKSMDDQWDGWVNGHEPVIDSYNYIVVASGGCEDKKVRKEYGTVTIVR